MRRGLRRGSLVVWALALGVSQQTSSLSARPLQAPAPAVASTPPAPAFVSRYCVTCHSTRLKSGGLALDALDADQRRDRHRDWEKVVRKLRTGAMPPLGAKRADEATSKRVIASLETALDKTAAANPNPGRPPLHRLNRAEYANAIRDLLDLDVEVASLLPPDDAAFGFDNVADVLGVSPLLLERYVDAAAEISEVAIGCARRLPRAAPSTGFGRISRRTGTSRGCPWGPSAGSSDVIRFRWTPSTSCGSSCIGPTSARCAASSTSTMSRSAWMVSASTWHAWAATEDLKKLFINGNTTGLGDEVDGRLKVRLRAEGRPALDRRRASPASPSRPTRGSSRRTSGAPPTPTTGRGIRTSTRSRSPGLSTPPVRATRRAAGGSSCAVRPPPTRGNRVRQDDPVDAGTPRLPPAGRRRRICSGLLTFYQAGRREGTFDTGYSDGAAAHSRQPEVRLPRRTRSGERGARRPVSSDRSGTGLAAVVLPVEQHPRRRAAAASRNRASCARRRC